MGTQRSSRNGFMLLIVVTMLAIVCLVFGQLAQLSLATMQRVKEQEKSARQRWTLVSLRKAALAQVPSVLTARERQVNLTNAAARHADSAIYYSQFSEHFQVNHQSVKLEARDESARLLLPDLLTVLTAQEARHLLERLQGSRRLAVRTTAFEAEGKQRVSRATSWSDVFEFGPANSEYLPEATDRVTLWGSGQLNVLRADEEVVSDLWRTLFGHFPPRQLLDAKLVYPPIEWSRLREQLNLREEQVPLADKWLSTRSDCFSLRVTLGAPTELQQRYLFVFDQSGQHYGFEE